MDKGYATFLPTKMESTFKGKSYKASIKGDLSLYNLEYISKADGDSSMTLFRVFDKRMFHQHNKGENLFLFERFDDPQVEFIDAPNKQIAGVNCKKAMIHFVSSDLPSIPVYYTEETEFKHPKENTPFNDIPGVLMEFQMPFKNLTLTFVAQKVDIKQIKDDVFAVPDNYMSSESDEIDELVSALIQ